MKIPFPALTALAVSASFLVSAQSSAQSLTPAENKRVDQMIDELHEKLHGSASKNNTRAVSTLQAILKSPKATYEYYLDCVKELQFDAEGKRESDWREWRKRNEDRLERPEHIAARHYQVKFLLLTLAVALEETEETGVKKVMPDLIEFYDDLTRDYERLEGQRSVLTGSALDSVFAKRLKLPLSLPRLETWVSSPLPVSGAYEGVILPHFRKEKNHPALQAAWDKRIVHESKTLTITTGGGALGLPVDLPVELPAGIPEDLLKRFGFDTRDRKREQKREETRQREVSEEEFTKERLPILRWGKHRDALRFGPNQASSFNTLGQIIRENLAHPDAPGWLDELKSFAAQGRTSPSADKAIEEEEEGQ